MTDADFLAAQKSTIVRSKKTPWGQPLARAGNRVLSRLAPGLAARVAERMFFRVPRHRRPVAETALLAGAEARPVRVGRRRVETWRWGLGPGVLLVHGWGGRGAQLGAFVAPLVASGFSVVTFDAPGHGASDAGPVTIPETVAAIREVAASRGRLAGLVAHSLGAMAATRALYEGLEVGAAVFVSPVAELGDPAARFTAALGFSRVHERLRPRIERRVGMPWSAFDVTALAPALSAPLLVVHDLGDAEVAWQHGRLVARAWPGAQLLLTDALGHRRILRDPDVVAATVAYLGARIAERGVAAAAATDGARATPIEVLMAG